MRVGAETPGTEAETEYNGQGNEWEPKNLPENIII